MNNDLCKIKTVFLTSETNIVQTNGSGGTGLCKVKLPNTFTTDDIISVKVINIIGNPINGNGNTGCNYMTTFDKTKDYVNIWYFNFNINSFKDTVAQVFISYIER